jgi:hypothetical protein
LPASPAPILLQELLSCSLVDAGSVLILSTVRWQVAISCAGVAVGPVFLLGTVEALVGTVAPLVKAVVLVVELLLLPHPASSAPATIASPSSGDRLRIIAAS